MATKTIQVQRLRTELIADSTKQAAEFKKAEGNVEKYGKTVAKVGKETGKAFDGAGAGSRFGKAFGASAIAELGSSFNVSTLGSLIGTAVAPGVGTAIGSAIGGGIDKAIGTVAPMILSIISSGIELNKLLEDTQVEFTATVGSEKEAKKYLGELLGISKDLGILPATVIETSERLSDLTGDLKLTRTLLKAAADQAADFGGSVETFQKFSDVLGQLALRGEDVGRALKQAYQAGINPYKRLSEATGLTVENIKKLAAANRLKGDVAARLIAESIEREKGGLAAYKTSQTLSGRERQFGVLTQLRAGEGTQEATRAMFDFYGRANAILDSPEAKAFTNFLNNTSGKIIDFTEGALKSGLTIGTGIAEGMIGGASFTSLAGSVVKLGKFTVSELNKYFESQSPSELTAREVGEPIGWGIGVGMVRRFTGYMQSEGRDEVVATLEALLRDPKIQALLHTIEKAEGGAINIMAGGRRVDSGARHPGEVVPKSLWFRSSKGPSSASGLYQETVANWRRAESVLGPLNFSDPHDQQLVALWLMTSHQGGAGALRSGNIGQMMGLAAKDWTSTPGSRIGGGGQWNTSKWLGQYQSFLGGKPINETNPMPVRLIGPVTMLDQYKAEHPDFGRVPTKKAGSVTVELASLTALNPEIPKLNDDIDYLVGDMRQLTYASKTSHFALATLGLGLPPIMKGVDDAMQNHADTSIALRKEYHEAAREELIKGMSIVDQIFGALGQVSGMMPQEQVGKKRSLFSKILGIAGPFLSLINPAFGPILSQIAGITSNALGGNWSGAISGISGGFTTGGVFRGNPSTATKPTTQPTTPIPFIGSFGGHRASGGPVYGGTPYWVGERQPELFVPNQNGQIYNQNQLMQMGSGGELVATLNELRAEIARLQSMPPDEIVMTGWRGLGRAMDLDGSASDQLGRRFNLG